MLKSQVLRKMIGELIDIATEYEKDEEKERNKQELKRPEVEWYAKRKKTWDDSTFPYSDSMSLYDLKKTMKDDGHCFGDWDFYKWENGKMIFLH